MSETQISKTLLILKSNANSTTAAEQFLRNREWVVFSTSNLKDFLTHIIQKKPSFVMISVDHPNKKVLMMPKVLAQSFPVCVFAFAENSSSISFRKLQDIQCMYRINPPATGPAIERTVNKYLRDQEKKLRDQEEKPTLDANGKPIASSVDGKTVIQHGGSFAEGAGAEVGGWNQAASVFSQLLEGEDIGKGGPQATEGSAGSGAGAGVIVAKGDKATEGSGAWVPMDPVDGKANQAGSFTGSSEANGASAGVAGALNKNTREGQGHFGLGDYSDLDADKPGLAGSLDSSSAAGSLSGPGKKNAPTGALPGASGENQKNGHLGKTEYKENEFEGAKSLDKTDLDPKSIQIGKNKDTHAGPPAGAGEDQKGGRLSSPKKYDKEQKTITILGKNTSSPLESIILKGTKQALDETVDVLDGEVNQELEDSSQVACIVVESEKFNGYLIAALGKNRKMDGKFIKAIQERLFKFLKDNGEKVSDKDNLNLKIKKVEFEDWALEYADFLKKSVHNGEEIAMAFFPVTNVRPEVGESAASTMASVKLSELEGDKVVEFNMYVYLPSNKKYILYTPKGGKFYGNQKGRLEEKGVKEVHMLKSEVNDLSKYKAQNYLNNLIENYKKKKTEPPKAA